MWTINRTYYNQKQFLFPSACFLPVGRNLFSGKTGPHTLPPQDCIQTQSKTLLSARLTWDHPRSGSHPAAGCRYHTDAQTPGELPGFCLRLPRCTTSIFAFLVLLFYSLNLPRSHLGFQRKVLCGTKCSGNCMRI